MSGRRNGFLPEVVEWADGFPVVPENQLVLMTEFQQVNASAIARLAEEKLQETEKKKVASDFNPSCAGSAPKVRPKI